MATDVYRAYQGLTKSFSNTGDRVSETYTGTEAQIDAFIATKAIGGIGTYGTLTSIDRHQLEGLLYQATLTYEKTNTSSGKQDSGTSNAATDKSLNSRMLSLPLESRFNYKTCWNYDLIAKGTSTLPDWWPIVSNTGIASNLMDTYKWVKEPSEIPTEADASGNRWYLLASKTMPGIESFDWPVYEITENSQHNNESQAGWVIAKKMGKIAVPSLGDFGIVSNFGGNWLVTGGSISYNGKRWVATLTYEHSPDGWNTLLYDTVNN